MTLNEYQQQAMTTCMKTSDNFTYMFLGLIGEVGEFASKVAKAVRKGKITINNDAICSLSSDEDDNALLDGLKAELGDIQWFVAGLAHVFDWDLENVGQVNLDKLSARKAAGTIDGNGDGISGAERTK